MFKALILFCSMPYAKQFWVFSEHPFIEKKKLKKLNNTTFFTWLWADRTKSRRLILLLTDDGISISYHFIQKGFGLNETFRTGS